MSPNNKRRDMWRNEDQDYIFPRINNLLYRTQLLNSEKKFKKIDKSNEEDRASSWKAWFAFMSSKHFPPDTSDGFSPEEVKRNAIFLAELMEKERRKVVEKSGKAPVGRPKMKKTLGDHVLGDKMRTNNNEEMKTPKQVVAGDAKYKRALEATTTTTKKTTTEPFRTSPSLAINMDQAKAIQHCDDGKKKITIRFTPDSELISNTIKSTRQNPIVDLTFRLRKKLGDICDHFSEKWKEAAALLEREAREEEKRKTGNENGLRNKAFMFTMRPNMRGDNSVNLEPCVVWDKQIIGDMTAVKAYEMRGYPETFEIKYSWRFAPLPPPDGSGDKKRKDYTYRTKMAIKEQMIANRDSANNDNNNKFDFSTVFDERTRTPLPPPEFTMSAFDVGAFVNGNEQEQPLETIKPSSQEKKRKIDTSSKFAKKPVPKEIKPETDSMLALKLQAELNGGNRERRNRKPMIEAEEEPEEEEEEEEYGGESDLENNDDNDMPISMWMKPEDGEKENTSTGDFPNSLLPQGLAGFDSIFAGIGKEDDASRPCGESTMNGFAQVIFGGGGESKDAAMVAACLPKRNVETGPSSFAGLLS